MFKRRFTPRKKQLSLLIALLVACVAAMFAMHKCSHNHATTFPVDYVKSGGDTIDVAIEMTPGCYSVQGDSAYGRDYEVIMKFSADTHRPVKLHPFVPLKFALDGLDSGDFDVVIAALPLTTQLKNRYRMTAPVYLDREVLVQRRDSITGAAKITSPDMLGGDTVWMAANSPFATRVKNLADELGQPITILTDPKYNSEHLFILVALGRIPCAVVSENTAKELSADYPQVDVSVNISFTQFQTWALRKDRTTLADSIDTWLRRGE